MATKMPFKQSSRILVASFIFGLALSLAISLPKIYKIKKRTTSDILYVL